MSENKVGQVYNRPWGNYVTLELSEGYQVKVITVNPKGKLSLQKHFKRCEHWVVVKGNPTFTIGDVKKTYGENDYVYINTEEVHRMENNTDQLCKIVEVQIGNYLGEDDIIRIEDIYDRT